MGEVSRLFISRKKYKELVERVEALERKSEVSTWDFGRVDLKELCKQLPKFIDKRIAADKNKLSTAEKN